MVTNEFYVNDKYKIVTMRPKLDIHIIDFPNVKSKFKMADVTRKKLDKFANHGNDYLRAPISQASANAENFDIKSALVNLVQQSKFASSTN
jgi:hypothetical protein